MDDCVTSALPRAIPAIPVRGEAASMIRNQNLFEERLSRDFHLTAVDEVR